LYSDSQASQECEQGCFVVGIQPEPEGVAGNGSFSHAGTGPPAWNVLGFQAVGIEHLLGDWRLARVWLAKEMGVSPGSDDGT
jgi:hypothetical protein